MKKQDAVSLLRRSAALFLGTIGVWVLLLCADASGLPHSGTRALPAALELSPQEEPTLWESMGWWERLTLSQSPLIWANRWITDPVCETEPAPPPEPAPEAAARDYEDLEPAPVTTAAAEDIVAQTLVPSRARSYEYAGGVYLYNRSGEAVDLSAAVAAPIPVRLSREGPQVLILHTHGTEAYTQDGQDRYEPSDPNTRTVDSACNVLRVGDEIQRVFTEMGLQVIHDRTLYDYPQFSGCYTRSREGVQKYLKEYPSLSIVLDIHRDALVGEDGTVYKAVTTIDGVPTAQVMLVVGGDGDRDGIHPDWMKNLTLAARLQRNMDILYPTLARPMTMRKSHYNQHLSPGSLLVEVGCHGNTLQEALAGARLFARAAGQVLVELKE